MLQQQTTSKLDEYKGERKLDVRIYAYFKKVFYVRPAWSVNTISSSF